MVKIMVRGIGYYAARSRQRPKGVKFFLAYRVCCAASYSLLRVFIRISPVQVSIVSCFLAEFERFSRMQSLVRVRPTSEVCDGIQHSEFRMCPQSAINNNHHR